MQQIGCGAFASWRKPSACRWDGFAFIVLVLIAALSSASSIPTLAERFDADAGRNARIVLFATVASFISFPAAVTLLV